MRLSTLEPGQAFKYQGNIYAHDLTGRSGSGKVAVKNLKTGEKKMIDASAEIELTSPDAEEPAEDITGEDDHPLKKYGLSPLGHKKPNTFPKVKEVKAVEEEHEE